MKAMVTSMPCVFFLLALFSFPSTADTAQPALAAQRKLEAGLQKYEVEYDIVSKQRDSIGAAHKMVDLKGSFKGLFSGTQFKYNLEEDTMYYPDASSPVQPLRRKTLVVFDGERHASLDVNNERARLAKGAPKGFILPGHSWRTLFGKPVSEYLTRPDLKNLGQQEFNGGTCEVFETRDSETAPGQLTAFRFWMDANNDWYPMCMEAFEVLEGGKLDLVESFKTIRLEHTPDGMPYSAEWNVVLTKPEGNGTRVTMLERTYRCKRFTTTVDVPQNAFAIVFPRGTIVDDEIEGGVCVEGEHGLEAIPPLRNTDQVAPKP